MIFDLDMIKAVYKELPAKIAKARKVVGKPLTLSEKILFSTCIRIRPWRTSVAENHT
jgi:hypothetical protein